MSTIENSKASAFLPGRRFIDSNLLQRSLPGPGQYDPNDYQEGNYIVSKYKNPGVRRFGTSARMQLKTPSIDTPGPGTYRQPSDFGYVDTIKQTSPRTAQSPRTMTMST